MFDKRSAAVGEVAPRGESWAARLFAKATVVAGLSVMAAAIPFGAGTGTALADTVIRTDPAAPTSATSECENLDGKTTQDLCNKACKLAGAGDSWHTTKVNGNIWYGFCYTAGSGNDPNRNS